ncbi:uncharacterized protein [Clytia hemisphaerica]|uniref:uncharacterized protein n=1 Tax=Clytia hemisphaerica TaxID=252671 RepID=UPI0034D658AB|eukprot:TCONS_00061216-protein
MAQVILMLLILSSSIAILVNAFPAQVLRRQRQRHHLQYLSNHYGCGWPKLERFISKLSLVSKAFGRTKWAVCPKSSTEEEWKLVNDLVDLKKVGLQDYLEQRQKCRNRFSNSASLQQTIEPEEEEEERISEIDDLQRNFPFGTVVKLRGDKCNSKGSLSANNTLTLCNHCEYDVTLPESYFPREHIHLTCHNKGDYSCLTGSGVCVMNNQPTMVLHDEHNVGMDQLSRWRIDRITFTKSCSCQIIRGDPLEGIIGKD